MNSGHMTIKQKLREQGYTQEMFAKRLGMGRETLNRKLNGAYAFTEAEKIAISSILGVEDEDVS